MLPRLRLVGISIAVAACASDSGGQSDAAVEVDTAEVSRDGDTADGGPELDAEPTPDLEPTHRPRAEPRPRPRATSSRWSLVA